MSAAHAVRQVMAELKTTGTTARLTGQMTPLTEVFDLLGLSAMLARDAAYANDDNDANAADDAASVSNRAV